jgi:hypothetical protein
MGRDLRIRTSGQHDGGLKAGNREIQRRSRAGRPPKPAIPGVFSATFDRNPRSAKR